MCNFTVAGQQPGNIYYIIISLSSGEEIEFPASNFMENHAVPSAGESAEVDDGSLPLYFPPDINDSDMHPPDVTLERKDDIEQV
ncbi:hypothetical protein H9Q69_005421 [Fusarium xylarioides]|uniref:Uncharacterized protein n=1 Tax=Fusarium xylarioides TaxID=221167 RepID=A0A9P7L9S9_9HYPO|nr:hypothetical protein H9Q70_009370 [Fusarium xylarioides]KAG5771362.1 hypothetical protein H9Q72_002051 [Fusarium xylarioides]KAG5776689.1 hypothetical protein H9Q73_009638 [Fusarium xylarioides]KAG5795531.1 hypothetical protein H9Q69_005421 [Fusarium xylarioides]